MDYEEFVDCLTAGLKELYGEEVVIKVEDILKNNEKRYHGMNIILKSARNQTITPVIDVDETYKKYKEGADMEECIREVYEARERYECTEDILSFVESLKEWETVKENVYPVLLSTKENREQLKELAYMPMLDLSVIYIIRGSGGKCVKVRKKMLKHYGIDSQELHRQAMVNMEKDGYSFLDMKELLKDAVCYLDGKDISHSDGLGRGKMYILTNSEKLYGAAGILDKELVRNFAGGRNFFILPSSIHETIFVPAEDLSDGLKMSKMVADVNETKVDREERLTNHCYYYDGQADEIRLCA